MPVQISGRTAPLNPSPVRERDDRAGGQHDDQRAQQRERQKRPIETGPHRIGLTVPRFFGQDRQRPGKRRLRQHPARYLLICAATPKNAIAAGAPRNPSKTGAILSWALAMRPAAANGIASRSTGRIALGPGHSMRIWGGRSQATAEGPPGTGGLNDGRQCQQFRHGPPGCESATRQQPTARPRRRFPRRARRRARAARLERPAPEKP